MRSPFPIAPWLAAGLLTLSGCGGGGGSATPIQPGTPGNLIATPGAGQVGLAWTAAASAASYTVRYHEQNAPEGTHQQTGLTASPTVVNGLLDHVPYVFSVEAVNGALSSPSTPVTATPVPAATLLSIAVTPVSASIGWPAQQAFTAVGHYSDGSTPDITSSVQWYSDTPGVVMTAGSVATGEATGSARISAHLDGVSSNEATVTVGAQLAGNTGNRTTSQTTTQTPVTLPIPMDVQSTLEDATWSATAVAITQQPSHGIASVAGLVVNYVPTAGYSGPDAIVLQETVKSCQIIELQGVVIGSNVTTNTDTRTITITVQ